MTRPSGLGFREILTLFFPLALTSTMMSASVPIINAGLARLPDPKMNLAAFGLAFTVGILLESPVFALQQAVVAWYPGHGRYRHLVIYALGVGLVVMAYEILIAFSPAAFFLFHELLGANEELSRRAVNAIRVAVVFAPFIAVRGALQGILISRRAPAAIGWGTFLRLGTLTVLTLWAAPHWNVEGPVAGMLALVAAVVVETVFVCFFLPRSAPRQGAAAPAHDRAHGVRARNRFILPLAGTMILGTLTNPLINAFIARTDDPETGLAAYAVTASLVWFLASPFLRFSSVTIAMGETDADRRRLERFILVLLVPLCTVLLLIHLTPLWQGLLHSVMGLTDELAEAVRLPLLLLSLQPMVAAFLAFNQGALTRAASTGAVGLGGVARVAAILACGFVGLGAGMAGSLLGGVLLGVSFLAEVLLLVVARNLLDRRRESLETRPRPGYAGRDPKPPTEMS